MTKSQALNVEYEELMTRAAEIEQPLPQFPIPTRPRLVRFPLSKTRPHNSRSTPTQCGYT